MITVEDWNGLNKEQINASRTIQQIKANIREIEKARKQTLDDDLCSFDDKVEDMKQRALAAVQEFIQQDPEVTSSVSVSKPGTTDTSKLAVTELCSLVVKASSQHTERDVAQR